MGFSLIFLPSLPPFLLHSWFIRPSWFIHIPFLSSYPQSHLRSLSCVFPPSRPTESCLVPNTTQAPPPSLSPRCNSALAQGLPLVLNLSHSLTFVYTLLLIFLRYCVSRAEVTSSPCWSVQPLQGAKHMSSKGLVHSYWINNLGRWGAWLRFCCFPSAPPVTWYWTQNRAAGSFVLHTLLRSSKAPGPRWRMCQHLWTWHWQWFIRGMCRKRSEWLKPMIKSLSQSQCCRAWCRAPELSFG